MYTVYLRCIYTPLNKRMQTILFSIHIMSILILYTSNTPNNKQSFQIIAVFLLINEKIKYLCDISSCFIFYPERDNLQSPVVQLIGF